MRSEYKVRDVVQRSHMVKLAVTLGLSASEAESMLVLPAGWHTVFCNPAIERSSLAADGLPSVDAILPYMADYPIRLFGGTEIRFVAPVAIGAPLECTSSVIDVVSKTGKSGALKIVKVQRNYAGAGGLAVSELQDIIYKQSPSPAADASPASGLVPASPDWSKECEFNEIDLFRFSALVFNSHRIHYDYPYVSEVEKKPGLLIQAKLLALHLLHACCTEKALVPLSFQYRSVAPMYAPARVRMSGVYSEGARQFHLEAHDAAGTLGMIARISF